MDASASATVAVKALGYLASLTAAGSALFIAVFDDLDAGTRQEVRRLGLVCACGSALAALALVPLGAVFLSGGSWSGALDPMFTHIVAHGPVGESLIVLGVGLVLLSVSFISRAATKSLGVAGAVIVCASFAFRGHVLAEPRLALGTLLTIHLIGLAFWIGALMPLFRLARHGNNERAGAAADAFGRRAVWVVAALALAGAGLLVLLTGNPFRALALPYVQFFVLKVSLFLLLLGAAAFNRLRLTPALLAGNPGAGLRLRRSIALEAATVCAIALTTATLSTVSAPET